MSDEQIPDEIREKFWAVMSDEPDEFRKIFWATHPNLAPIPLKLIEVEVIELPKGDL